MTAAPLRLAFDRSRGWAYDADGRLHSKSSRISMATVNPYWAREIPNATRYGFTGDRTYLAYRPPDELRKAAASANNLPLLQKHVPVNAEDHRPTDVVGATGSNAVFDAPFLRNSLVIWAARSIRSVEDGSRAALSCGYAYDVDPTPGRAPDGTKYDFVMRNLRFNHLALVQDGRAGPDVVVGDAALSDLAYDDANFPHRNRLQSDFSSRNPGAARIRIER